jgi:hypothetical protein
MMPVLRMRIIEEGDTYKCVQDALSTAVQSSSCHIHGNAVRGAFFSDPLDGVVKTVTMLFQVAPPPRL